ncbi:MAG: glycosyl transferase [Betaproteobacteria bacterium RIFCSPLOWO2_12_FULL_65_110]|nr:MAG: glycosyl transferase [Betaproteobacteria bacterium RIFCSPLOWO2_12_FULL_65_110]
MTETRIAVLVPCCNEAATVAAVVSGFRMALPAAEVYVYDNNSSDGTADRAREAGATVRPEGRQGKGHVVRRMLADLDADIYVMVDGDDTYDPASSPAMIAKMLSEKLDLVNGRRIETHADSYRFGHRWGNQFLSGLVSRLFDSRFDDVLSGYKVFSRRFAKSFPVLSTGFEIETEIAVHALSLGVPTAEMDTPYRSRQAGSASKLSTFRDGIRILGAIVILYKEEKPLAFFAGVATVLAAVSVGLALPVIIEFMNTGLVPRQPTALLATGVMLSALLSFACGVILESVKRGQREIKRLFYLQTPER